MFYNGGFFCDWLVCLKPKNPQISLAHPHFNELATSTGHFDFSNFVKKSLGNMAFQRKWPTIWLSGTLRKIDSTIVINGGPNEFD